jgi:hypothetical protein
VSIEDATSDLYSDARPPPAAHALGSQVGFACRVRERSLSSMRMRLVRQYSRPLLEVLALAKLAHRMSTWPTRDGPEPPTRHVLSEASSCQRPELRPNEAPFQHSRTQSRRRSLRVVASESSILNMNDRSVDWRIWQPAIFSSSQVESAKPHVIFLGAHVPARAIRSACRGPAPRRSCQQCVR